MYDHKEEISDKSTENRKKPENRTIDELMSKGIIIVDKPPGPTSHEVTTWVKKILHCNKTGHAGTLDPLVTGVLPVGLNKSTILLPYLTEKEKEYVGVMRFGREIDENEVKEFFSAFTGLIEQMPPRKSAVKRRLRKRHVYKFDLLEINDNKKDVLFDVSCEAGTYIRALVRDIAERFNIPARLIELRRIRVGHITEDMAHNLQEVQDAYIIWKEKGEEKYIRQIIKPIDTMLSIPKVYVNENVIHSLTHGSPLFAPGIHLRDDEIMNINHNTLIGLEAGDIVGIYTINNELIMVGELTVSGREILEMKKGLIIKPKRVFVN
ncbi:RNA-guided pseudouridylation complex pseudouridine synthase subunit Cbf5 [Candidatus Micrarchaeota archaeon]|nr:RNA-guided pseudouridylation complex pseudouridine synthase subunit Cbf5 [Candidatus Micrarchaeota archaeon]